jgi:hypothetical protein
MLPARHPAETSLEAALPTVQAIQEIESRQDEVLRKLDELEKRIAQTLAQFGDQRYSKSAIDSPQPEIDPVPVRRVA